MIPHDLLPWDAAYRWYHIWTTNGTIDHIHDALRDQIRINGYLWGQHFWSPSYFAGSCGGAPWNT